MSSVSSPRVETTNLASSRPSASRTLRVSTSSVGSVIATTGTPSSNP
jgi:hypothetical protein